MPDRVADRGRGVAGAHDVVLGLRDRAERREAAVLADRRELVAAAGEDLVRVGLVADVPEDLVLRRVEQRVQRDRQLAGAEVRAEVAADLADRVDDVLAHLLRELRELLLGERRAGPAAVDRSIAAGSSSVPLCRLQARRCRLMSVRVEMKSVICSSSSVRAAAPRALDGVCASALRAPCGGTPPPALARARSRTRSRTCACRDAHRCLAAFRVHRRCRSRRGCRRRSGTARPARPRNGGKGSRRRSVGDPRQQ